MNKLRQLFSFHWGEEGGPSQPGFTVILTPCSLWIDWFYRFGGLPANDTKVILAIGWARWGADKKRHFRPRVHLYHMRRGDLALLKG